MEDFFSRYLAYAGKNESPVIYNRWAAISMLGALIGRNLSIPFGHSKIYPNQYILFIGTPGTRKGTAIRPARKLIEAAGYEHIAPNKAAKEALWEWMAKQIRDKAENDFSLSLNLENEITHAYVCHDEFADFIGIGDDSFITNLTNMWDNLAKYTNPKMRTNDVLVPNPTFNILSGMTPVGVAESFRSIALGGGFFSRLIFVHSNPTKLKITFPEDPNPVIQEELVVRLKRIAKMSGYMTLTLEARELVDRVYKECPDVLDARFEHYMQRRFIHFLKLSIILAASDERYEITKEDIIRANTILAATEIRMPKALGEYGKAKNAEVVNAVLHLIRKSKRPLTPRVIWKHISRDLNKFAELGDILNNLVQADKITGTASLKGQVYIPKAQKTAVWPDDLIDYSYLTESETKIEED